LIIKGKSRGGPKQLATHLLRADTNERVEVLELQSTAATLPEAFREWQLIAEGTKGTRGLYHANIDPDARYTMTAEQWHRAVDVLERELGLDGQPRAVVLHEKQGRQHIHVVWQRTDIDTMTLVSDSRNYHAHERASLALEQEFGHEIVAGKHAKRDDSQPTPQSEINHAEWQQAERTGIDPRELKDQVTALYHASDSGASFQQVLDQAGLIIAKGDRRDFVIVDEAGEVHSLARQIRGVTTKDLRAFMADVDRETLPTVEEAKALQKDRPAPEPPALAEVPETPRPVDGGSEGVPLDEALRAWHAEDMRRLAEFHAAEMDRRATMLDEKIAARLEKSDARRTEALAQYDAQAERSALARIVDRVIGMVAPAWAERRQAERDEARQAAVNALDRERKQEVTRLDAAKQAELADLAERQAEQTRTREAQFTEELACRVRDYEEAQRFAAQLAEQERQRQEAMQQSHSPGPEPPTRAR
jgi:hypothetical protein